MGVQQQPIRRSRTSGSVLAVQRILSSLQRTYPDASCALDYESPLQLLVATILSSQTTDEQVNNVVPLLFNRYPTVNDLASAERNELERYIRPTGFFRQKARYIQITCQMLLEEYGGKVPDELPALTRLPGISRKSANLIMGEAFDQQVGIVVDTHVKRVSRRLGLSHAKSPDGVERELVTLLPRDQWSQASHLLSVHGLRVCHPSRPECGKCILSRLCPSAEIR